MRNKPKLDLGLSAYEELFMDKNELIEARLAKIYDIPIDLIDDFPDHPFKVKMDEDLDLLISLFYSLINYPSSVCCAIVSIGGPLTPDSFIKAAQ